MAKRRRERNRMGRDDPAGRERARETLHQALDRGEDPEQAARRALSVSPECVEAILLLADFATSEQEARDRVREAVATATAVLGEAGLREGRGRMGETADGAAYVHALAAMARHQVAEGRVAQGIQTFHGLLAMDPADPVQVRGDLLILLLAEDRDDEAEDLLTGYPEEANADWTYARALLRFRRAEDEAAHARATDALDRALARFPAAGRAILGVGDAPPAPGSDDALRRCWRATQDATAWLAQREASARAKVEAPRVATPSLTSMEADRRFSAREHVEEAWEATGARREALARAALDVWPDCVEAWRALATVAGTPEERVARLTAAVEAGARALVSLPDERPASESDEAREVLRARRDLAEALRAAGREDEAREQERRLLGEDADDATGAALPVVARLLAAGLDEEAAAWIARRVDDASPGWAWARVLAARRRGTSVETSFALAEATLVAPLVGPLLLAGDLRLDDPESAGSADAWDAARRAADVLRPAWAATPGALEWLAERLPPPRAGSRSRPGRGATRP